MKDAMQSLLYGMYILGTCTVVLGFCSTVKSFCRKRLKRGENYDGK